MDFIRQLLHSAPTFLSSFHKSVPISISNHSWDTSKLLLPSDDVETNSGSNPVFCSTCSSKINRGIQQNMAPTCSDTNCNGRCNQAWNGATTNETRHAKSCGRTITEMPSTWHWCCWNYLTSSCLWASQVVLLLQVNFAPSVIILFTPVMPT